MARFNRIYIEVLSVIAQQLPGPQLCAENIAKLPIARPAPSNFLESRLPPS